MYVELGHDESIHLSSGVLFFILLLHIVVLNSYVCQYIILLF
jgi:hypothetical protein